MVRQGLSRFESWGQDSVFDDAVREALEGLWLIDGEEQHGGLFHNDFQSQYSVNGDI